MRQFDESFLNRLEEEAKKWETECPESVASSDEGEPEFATTSGIKVKRTYTPLDLDRKKISYFNHIGFPGLPPYTRGIEPDMYRAKVWERVQYVGYGLPEQTNERIKYLMSQGQTGFYLGLDLPTQLLYDPDHPDARGEVGKVGPSISSLRDMEVILEGLPLDQLSQIRTTAMSNGPVIAGMFILALKKSGIDPNKISVRIQNDVIKEYVARGTQIFPIEAGLKFAIDLVEYCTKYLPNWSPLSVAGSHMRMAGATAIEELAFTMANAYTYIRASLDRGLGVDDVAPNIHGLMSVNTLDIFEEISKLRAARQLWYILLKEHFGAEEEESLKLKLNSFASGYFSTAQEPLNNIARVAIETLAVALAGAQDVGVSAYDEPLSTPSPEAALVALRTSQIVAYETGLANVVDPLGGSYFVETLTREIFEKAMQEFERVQANGGSLQCIKKGYFQEAIAKGGYDFQRKVESGEKVLIGVNKFQSTEKPKIKAFKIDPSVEKQQIIRIQELKRSRNNALVEKSLEKLRHEAESGNNTMPALMDALEAYATVGEIGDCLRDVWGEWR